jgi:hypothetical protein
MKKLFLSLHLLLASCFLAPLLTYAQTEVDWAGKTYKFGGIYPGYIVTLNGDTVKGYVQHNNRVDNQDKAYFYTDPNSNKTKKSYNPSELKGYMVGDKVYRSIEWSGGLFGKMMKFNLLEKDGAIAQYTFYAKSEGYMIQVHNKDEDDYAYDARVSERQSVFQKRNEKPFDQTSLGLSFAKKTSELVSDYPELAAKVKNKEKGYGMLNLLEIIDEYNRWAAAK